MDDGNSSPSASDGQQTFHGIVIEKEDPEKLFEQLQILGKGTFGTVVKCRNRLTNEIIAAKQILLVNDDEMDIVRREIRILQECSHPNIVAYRGTYLTLNTLWIAMEYCAGGSVDCIYKFLKRPLPEPLIAYVCREVLQGLVYLHRGHKIHRDIKGSNVLLTDDGHVKLADFGVSTELLHTLSKRNSFIGTLYWMAPEAIQEKEYDERADIWSLAITVIEMAEGCPPRSGYPYARALFAIPKEPPPRLATHRGDLWSPLMHNFVDRMLEKIPRKRPTSFQLLQDPFLAPERVGTAEALAEWIGELSRRMEALPTARRLGEQSTGSSATFVQRRSSSGGDDDRENDILSSDDEGGNMGGGEKKRRLGRQQTKVGEDVGAADGGSGGAVYSAPGGPSAADDPASLLAQPAFFHDGTLLQLPLLHTEDISFDEICVGRGSGAPPTSTSSALRLLAASSGTSHDALGEPHQAHHHQPHGRLTGIAALSFPVPEQQLHHATKSLLASFQYHAETIHVHAGVGGPEAAEKSRKLAETYGSALKTMLRV